MSQPAHSGPAERVGVAGSGAVACGVAASVALAGIEVRLWARSDESAARAAEAVGRELERAERSFGDRRVEVVRDLAELGTATLLIEAVAEDEYVKRQVLESVAAGAGP